MIRLTFVLRRGADMSRESFQDYWRSTHAPLVATHAEALGIRRYVQVHTLDDPANTAMANRRGTMEDPFDGVAELWFDSLAAMTAAGSTDAGHEAAAALIEDEATFIDLAASPLWLAVEHPQVNPTPETLVAQPASSIVKLHYPLRCPENWDQDQAQQYWFTQHGPLIRRHAQAMGIQRYVQVHRIATPVEEALRRARGTEVAPYMGHAELWFDRRDTVPTPERHVGGEAAVEDESHFIDFARSAIFFAKEHVVFDWR